jgi:arylsulfatase
MMVKEIHNMGGPATSYSIPRFYNLLQDPKEEHGSRLLPANLWVRYPASQVLIEHAMSLGKEPPIKAGTPDPYVPKKK